MQTLIVTFVVKEGCEKQFETEFGELQRATAGEPGSVFYDLHRGQPGSRTYHLYERYRDNAAMKTHLASAHLAAALPKIGPLLAQPLAMIETDLLATLRPQNVTIEGKSATVHIIPLGPANLVFAQTARGILACGAIDPAALERFGLPTVRVKPTRGTSIANLDDLLAGEVRDANPKAETLGVRVGMSGREALAKL